MPALFCATTFAFGMVAPDGSLTNPEILPRSDCANAVVKLKEIKNAAHARKRRKRFTSIGIFALSLVFRYCWFVRLGCIERNTLFGGVLERALARQFAIDIHWIEERKYLPFNWACK